MKIPEPGGRQRIAQGVNPGWGSTAATLATVATAATHDDPSHPRVHTLGYCMAPYGLKIGGIGIMAHQGVNPGWGSDGG